MLAYRMGFFFVKRNRRLRPFLEDADMRYALFRQTGCNRAMNVAFMRLSARGHAFYNFDIA